MPQADHHRFISEPIVPTLLGAPTVVGEPGTPMRFRWRGQEHEIARVIEKWKTTGPCTHGSGERYVKRHWLKIETTGGAEMEIYFERHPRPGQLKKRWWLAVVSPAAETGPVSDLQSR
ncbi:MAG: DUF6504 family protein [Chthoniobacteraceae bacterium]|jgi:phosphoribosylglycinamide formyltransferase-1